MVCVSGSFFCHQKSFTKNFFDGIYGTKSVAQKKHLDHHCLEINLIFYTHKYERKRAGIAN